MSDYSGAVKRIGNHFNMVLIASERIRELERARLKAGEGVKVVRNRKPNLPHLEALQDISDGRVGVEYLLKVAKRGR